MNIRALVVVFAWSTSLLPACAAEPAQPTTAQCSPATEGGEEPKTLPAATPIDRTAAINELMDLAKLPEVMTAFFEQYKQLVLKNNPNFPPELWDTFRKDFSTELLRNTIFPIYQEHLTDAEISAMLDFLRRPEGRSVMAKQPQLLTLSMQAGARWGEVLGGNAVALWLKEHGK